MYFEEIVRKYGACELRGRIVASVQKFVPAMWRAPTSLHAALADTPFDLINSAVGRRQRVSDRGVLPTQ